MPIMKTQMKMRILYRIRPGLIALLVLGVLAAAGLLAVAVAQSNRMSFSLNSPASFPVDIKMKRLNIFAQKDKTLHR